jgi:hypothetical protein
LNIYQRIAAAYKDIAAETFEKSGTVAGTGGGYKFIPIGQILNIIRQAHSKHGIIVIFGSPSYKEDQGEKRYTYVKDNNSYKTTWSAAWGRIPVRIYGNSADDRIETEIPFEAQDNSDKLTNKIITNAERCLYRTLYAIDEGGEDPESMNDARDNIVEETKKTPQKERPKPAPPVMATTSVKMPAPSFANAADSAAIQKQSTALPPADHKSMVADLNMYASAYPKAAKAIEEALVDFACDSVNRLEDDFLTALWKKITDDYVATKVV